jgi:lambda family phage portal protein
MLNTETNTVNIAGRQLQVKRTPVDRLISFFSPALGVKRQRARLIEAMSGAWTGASTTRRSMRSWITQSSDADSDIIYDLPTLRERSRDLIRNAPIATGAQGTAVANVVGTGLKLQARIDAEFLGMTDEEADAWQDRTEREWQLFAESTECDVARTLNFYGIQSLAFRQTFENGDVFCLTPRIKRGNFPYSLKLQLVEADRVCNENYAPDRAGLIAGIEKDEITGEPLQYHIMNQHPDSAYVIPKDGYKWTKIPAYGKNSGLRNVIHLYEMLRPGQTRGVPSLAPVIETLKVLSQYTENELMASTVASLFTVFIKTETGDLDFSTMNGIGTEVGAETTDNDVKLGNGAVVGLGKNESVETANPGRPNSAFDPFVKAITEQIGAALGIPYEVLVRHFDASYSASRAALLEAWRFFRSRRSWLVSMFCQPVYEIWLYEAVASGRITAPGFFADPLIAKAYAKTVWIGDSPGYIDPQKDVAACKERIDSLLSTYDEETALLTGGDFESNVRQRSKEKRMLDKAGLLPEPKVKPQQVEVIEK